MEKPQPPSPLLTMSCLHYQAHEKPKTDHFEIILSTPKMQAAAWKFGHKKQVLMDLTFGVCLAQALLMILMTLDENGTGIPICFIMFTAWESAKATHADYDTALLDQLLGIFKQRLGCNEHGDKIDFSIGNTDNDPHECASLSKHWPGILLLLHVPHLAGLEEHAQPTSSACSKRQTASACMQTAWETSDGLTQGEIKTHHSHGLIYGGS